MKKIFFLTIGCLVIFFIWQSAQAQVNLVNCGSTSVDLDNLMLGKDDPEKNSVLVCLGQQILKPNARAKATIIDSKYYGRLEIYIERSADSNFTGKITYGKPESIVKQETKIFAETFFVCPINLDSLRSENPKINFDSNPGNLAVKSYLRMHTLRSVRSAGSQSSCSGTFFDVDVSKNNTGRATFASLLNQDLIDLIERGVQVASSSENKICDDKSAEVETDCAAFFHSPEKDRLNNPVRSLALRIKKINVVRNGEWDIYSTIATALEKYNFMVKSYFPEQYEKSGTKEEVESYPQDNYAKFSKDDSELYVALKDGWILEVEATRNIPDSLMAAILEDLGDGINDLLNVNINNFEITEKAETEDEELAEEEEIVFSEEEKGEEKKEGKPIDLSLAEKLKGKIMIRVEANGEAYYIDPITGKMYYLGRPEDAFNLMRELGVGITTADIKKIPIGFIKLTGPDADNDGLSDIFEDAIFTDKNKADTDGDGYSDRQEVEGGFNPLVAGGQKMIFNSTFADKQKGKIFLQVEDNGEAWYVYPDNSKRYFLGRPADAFNIMRTLGLGISDNDFSKLGEVEK